MKQFGNITINAPSSVTHDIDLVSWNAWFLPIYTHLYDQLPDTLEVVTPLIDFDRLKLPSGAFQGIHALALDVTSNAKHIAALRKLHPGVTDAPAWKKDPERSLLTHFLHAFPAFTHLIQNINIKADLAINATELVLGEAVNANNFMTFKSFLDKINRERWTRQQDISESQSGTSILGTTSERLLELSMEALIDDTKFFKVNNDKVSSYGDFVLMCLPNNLWLSVKSNFARERLLASGYTTDIVGVGYFTDKSEFTSPGKIRNFQRVGFLAMYIPDVPISADQLEHNTNTYQQVLDDYAGRGRDLPLNINGTPFLRPLSRIGADMQQLLSETDIKRRLVLDL